MAHGDRIDGDRTPLTRNPIFHLVVVCGTVVLIYWLATNSPHYKREHAIRWQHQVHGELIRRVGYHIGVYSGFADGTSETALSEDVHLRHALNPHTQRFRYYAGMQPGHRFRYRHVDERITVDESEQ